MTAIEKLIEAAEACLEYKSGWSTAMAAAIAPARAEWERTRERLETLKRAVGLEACRRPHPRPRHRWEGRVRQWTPGPWAVEGDDRPGMGWNDHIVQAANPNIRIAFMTSNGPRANARLLAAAPDLVDELMGVTASLVAAVSLLKRSSKKAAPSDKMFDMMIADYEKAIETARAVLTRVIGQERDDAARATDGRGE